MIEFDEILRFYKYFDSFIDFIKLPWSYHTKYKLMLSSIGLISSLYFIYFLESIIYGVITLKENKNINHIRFQKISKIYQIIFTRKKITIYLIIFFIIFFLLSYVLFRIHLNLRIPNITNGIIWSTIISLFISLLISIFIIFLSYFNILTKNLFEQLPIIMRKTFFLIMNFRSNIKLILLDKKSLMIRINQLEKKLKEYEKQK
tara:strand:+ start:544 stop:1152 length:609 start_codon:yes stop_codon:yes gene_type:complete